MKITIEIDINTKCKFDIIKRQIEYMKNEFLDYDFIINELLDNYIKKYNINMEKAKEYERGY